MHHAPTSDHAPRTYLPAKRGLRMAASIDGIPLTNDSRVRGADSISDLGQLTCIHVFRHNSLLVQHLLRKWEPSQPITGRACLLRSQAARTPKGPGTSSTPARDASSQAPGLLAPTEN
jgi:hypothetical protein